MAKFNTDGRIGIADLDTVDTTARVPLGTRITGYDTVTQQEGTFVYVQFAATTTVGQVVRLDSTNKAVLFDNDNDANLGGSIGWACGASYAADEYGWVQVAGKIKAKAGTVAANGKVFGTATAGTVDDAAVNGCQILGAKFATADGTPAAGFAYIEANNPHSQGQTV